MAMITQKGIHTSMSGTSGKSTRRFQNLPISEFAK